MYLSERLKNARKQKKISLSKLSELTGIAKSTLQRYETGSTTKIPIEAISIIEKAMHLETGLLMGWGEESYALSDIQGTLPIKTKKVPLLGTIACGDPILATENIDEYVLADGSVQCDFALRCKGDSMINARIFDGDIVYIRQQADVDNGEIAAILIGDEATIKRVYKYPDRMILQPENPTFQPMVYEGDKLNEIRIIGKAVAFTSVVR